MAKLSVSLEDDLAAQLKEAAGANVSAFVAGAVRRQLEQQQLGAFLAELEDELGPPHEAELAEAAAAFEKVKAASSHRAPAERRGPLGSTRSRSRRA